MKRLLICPWILMISLFHSTAFGQKTYYPKGNPREFQAEVTVPLWLPWIKGEVGMDGLLKSVQADLNATPAALLNNLKGAFLINADVSKNDFVGFVNYMHIKLETAKTTAQLPLGGSMTWSVQLKNDILDLAAGRRIHFKKGMVDPFIGVRYFNVNNSLDATTVNTSKNVTQKIDYWDPFFGARVFYYPKERLLLFARTDIGGIWGGSPEFSWNVEGKIGYALSPLIDISGGFRSYSFKYAEYIDDGRVFYMNPHLYGFEIGVTFMIPKRKNDTNVFPNKKKKIQ